MAFDATPESVCEEAVTHFRDLLKSNMLVAKKSNVFGESSSDDDDEEKKNDNDDDDDDNDENGKRDKAEDELDEILPTCDPQDLELYVYHVEDPDMFRKDFTIKGSGGGGGGDDGAGFTDGAAKSRASKAANIMQEILAEQQQAGRANRVNHTSISIGDYESSPPTVPEVPLRIQLSLFQLIAAARKRRRKFIVRSGLHPSAVEDCSPLNIYAVITVSPFWLERRALEIQEETAREDVLLSEQKYMRAIREAHIVSHNRADARAKGHKQIRAFNGEVENLFLKLALRHALVKQASMSVHDVVEKHMKDWPRTMRVREAMFQQELKKRRCLLADYVQRLRLQEKIVITLKEHQQHGML